MKNVTIEWNHMSISFFTHCEVKPGSSLGRIFNNTVFDLAFLQGMSPPSTKQLYLPIIKKKTVMAIYFHQTLSPFSWGRFVVLARANRRFLKPYGERKSIHGAAVRRFAIYRRWKLLGKFLEAVWRNRSGCLIKQQIVKTNILRRLLERTLSNLSIINEKKNDWISIIQEVYPSCWKLECSVNEHNLRQQLNWRQETAKYLHTRSRYDITRSGQLL